MNVYRRYFKIPKTSPFFARITEISEQHQKYREGLEQIKKEVGAKSVYTYNHDASFAGFGFEPPADSKIWTKKKDGAQRPKTATKEGRALLKRISDLGRPSKLMDAFEGCGIDRMNWNVQSGMAFYNCGMAFMRDQYLFLTVPWFDADPAEIELHKSGKEKSGNIEHILWNPPIDWAEVKEWEMKRDIDQAKESMK